MESLRIEMSLKYRSKKKRTPRRGDSSARILHSSRLILRGRVLYWATRLFVVQISSIAGLRSIARAIICDFEFQQVSTGLIMRRGLIFAATHDAFTSLRSPAELLTLNESLVSCKT